MVYPLHEYINDQGLRYKFLIYIKIYMFMGYIWKFKFKAVFSLLNNFTHSCYTIRLRLYTYHLFHVYIIPNI